MDHTQNLDALADQCAGWIRRAEETAAFDLIIANAVAIERLAVIDGLRPWFDVRGVAAFARRTFGGFPVRQRELHEGLARHAPGFRAGLVAAAEFALEQGRLADALEFLGKSSRLQWQDLHVQGLMADCHLALSNGAHAGGHAPRAHWAGRYCSAPFEHFEPIDSGDVFVCCPGHVPYSIGNIYTQSIEEIWASPTAWEIRRSILDGSFRYCSKAHCDRLLGNRLPPLGTRTIPEERILGKHAPTEIVLNHDRSCNLTCPSCRTTRIVAGEAERQRLDTVREQIVRLVNGAENVVITNAGDPFASRHYRGILQEMRPLRRLGLKLYTNAQLFTREEWERLRHLRDCNISVDVSIDAARPETYAELRRGGDFQRLLNNLGFIAALRREGAIQRFMINMTVQAANFREMPAFARLGKELGVDVVYFLRLRDWGTYGSAEEFAERDVSAPEHAQHHELRALVKDPVLADPIVEFRTLPLFA